MFLNGYTIGILCMESFVGWALMSSCLLPVRGVGHGLMRRQTRDADRQYLAGYLRSHYGRGRFSPRRQKSNWRTALYGGHSLSDRDNVHF